MRKKITSVALAIIFSLSMAGVSLAAKCKGTVESVEEGKIVITLDGKCKLKAGEAVNVKTKKKAIEGC
jgi:chaperone required for assembly of F1-ATPase